MALRCLAAASTVNVTSNKDRNSPRYRTHILQCCMTRKEHISDQSRNHVIGKAEILITDAFNEAVEVNGNNATGCDKFCHGCARWLAPSEYSFKDRARRVLRSRCRRCCCERSKRHYVRMKRAYLARNRRRKPMLREVAAMFVHQFLRQHPCVHCGEEDPVVLEFNHIDPALKSGNISEMIRTGTSVRRLQAEIAKFEVLCANCHQRHTIRGKTAHYTTVASTLGPSWRQAANRRNAALVLEHLRSAACVDCGSRDPLVVQFDHRPDAGKVKDIASYVSSGSRTSLLVQEMSKCDVRCANCHRRRTAVARAWFRARVRTRDAA